MTRFAMAPILTAAILFVAAMPLAAEPLSGKAARKLLFAPDKAEVEMLPGHGLSDAEVKVLAMVGGDQPYYGAIAISPAEGIMVEATVAAVNHHSTEAAAVAALKGCDEKRKAEEPCKVVALIRPEGWEPRAIMLSRDATAALRKDYKAPGAVAISPSTGMFALVAGDGAAEPAVAECAKSSDAADCIAVVSD
ncbi:MAG: 5-aminolevulic acid synthase [Gemmobacter sp.]|jgi:hypothetical protein|nr:5-aminolevulic acid synthase [Gemmobacter sp.]